MSDKKEHNITEIITFTAGLIVILAVIGFLIYQISEKKAAPPELHITTAYQPSLRNYVFKVEVENKGEETAEAANIKLSLYQEGKTVEDGTVNIDYVPVRSKRTTWIVFYTDRKPGDSLIVSSVTYVKP